MIHHTLIRYAFDSTGVNPDNLVRDEHHTLADKRFRAIAPMYGVFYTEGFVLVDRVTGNTLLRGQDYVFAELHQSLTLEIGKEIAGIAIVINSAVSSDVAISYQCVGGHYGVDGATLESLLAKEANGDVSLSYHDIANKPATFVPSPHMHDLGDVQGMDVLLYQLERIRNIIIWSDSNFTETLMRYVVDTIDNITARLINRVNNEYLSLVIEYKKNFTKVFAGLGNVANYTIATAAEGREVANADYSIDLSQEDKYVTTEAITAYKEMLYSILVSSDLTQLGKTYGTIILSRLQSIADMPAGSSFILDALATVKASGVSYDAVVYPNESETAHRWVIHKIIDKPSVKGGIVFAANMTTGTVYTGDLNISNSGTITLRWFKHMNETDAEGFLDRLIAHMQDENNPHKDRKKHVALGDVENLGVATKEDIVCRKPVRKYITYDGLLLYAKAFLTGIKDEDDVLMDDQSQNALEMYQTIFAPCGPCGSLKTQVVQVPVQTCDETGKLLFTYCEAGFVKKGVYADGNCGVYTEILEENSKECGYIDTPVLAWTYPTPLYNEAGKFLGYEVTGTKDSSFTNPEWLINAYDPIEADEPTPEKPVPEPGLGEGEFVFDADFIVIEYYFSDGLDLDTRTRLLEPATYNDIGWARNDSRYDGWLFWSGDNTGSGTESVYINIPAFKNRFPNESSFKLQCSAFWYSVRGSNPVKLKLTAYKGGSMVLSNYRWKNTTFTEKMYFQSIDKIVTIKQSENIDGEIIGYVEYDTSTGHGSVTIV